MSSEYTVTISAELNIRPEQTQAVIALLAEGATVPFIARYRKEATGSLDEVVITSIRDRLGQLEELDKRRKTILDTIAEQGKLTPELKAGIMAAGTMAALEDIYLPYKPKRRTRATVAREKGLEPLAVMLMEQGDFDVTAEAAKYISEEKGVGGAEDALAGARDIIAEQVNENAEAREKIRTLFRNSGMFISKVVKGKEDEGSKYRDYFEWSEPVSSAPSHRILAMRRGADEKFLVMKIEAPEEQAQKILELIFVKAHNGAAGQVRAAVIDSYKRLLSLSMETEIRLETKKRADEEAIRVFVGNVRQLLLSPPLGQKKVLALDPGFRTGCKLVCLDSQGKLIFNDTIYPHNSQDKAVQDGLKIRVLCEKFGIEAIAIGNGTAGRETESFIRSLGLPAGIAVVMVNESGASVYSASDVAREEFPDHDITVRGSVSIGRRLMDPLAELVKIDPKSIGVGQYQHDVDQKKLKSSLDDTVMSCVNSVGVDVNTASRQLLSYVSGVGQSLADKIVNCRNENGAFADRQNLKMVQGMGEKTFEQCAGFLRIRGSANPLDASAVHPESYPIVSRIAGDLGCTVSDLLKQKELRQGIELAKYVTDKVGMPTLCDIRDELEKPGRDPRQSFEAFSFTDGINEIKDLSAGMKLAGIVTNVTAFGAFVDIGVHQDGLVHISQLSDSFVSDPNNVVKVHQRVEVTVLEVDADRKRISLSMKSKPEPGQARPAKRAAGETDRKKEPKPNKPADAGKNNRDNKQNRQNTSGRDEPFGDRLQIRLN